MAGLPGQARAVGYALHALPEQSNVPWHRVVNAKREISHLPDPDCGIKQRLLLESEGIVFDQKGRIASGMFIGNRPDKKIKQGNPF
jgi:methylated-DNA-protein-cysteine methyltransferase-like protein